MALSNTTVKAIYTGNGSNQDFAIPFTPIFSDSAETVVYRVNVSTTPYTVTLLTEGAFNDYTLTGAPDASSFDTTVHMNTAPTTSHRIVVVRALPKTQTLDLIAGGPPMVSETPLDRIVAMVQEAQERLGRALVLHPATLITEANMQLPQPVANNLIGWNSAGTAVQNYTPASVASAGGGGIATTDDLPEGSTNKYFNGKVLDDLPDVTITSPISGHKLKYNGTIWVNTSDLTTKGDILTYGTAETRMGVGTNGYPLVANSNATNGVAWEDLSHKGELRNLSIQAEVAANALTVSVKTRDGSNASTTNPIRVGMRQTLPSDDGYLTYAITSALSVTVSSGSNLGHTNNNPSYIYVYLIDFFGTVEVAVSSRKFTDDGVVSTTAEGGAGAADSSGTIYSTTARSNVSFRLIGRLTSTQTTAGTWAAVITQISIMPFEMAGEDVELYLDDGNGHGSANTCIRRFTTAHRNTLGAHATYADSTTAGMSITIHIPGLYGFEWADSESGLAENLGITVNEGATLSTIVTSLTYAQGVRIRGQSTAAVEANISGFIRLAAGDVVRAHTEGGADNSVVASYFKMIRLGD